MVAGRLPIERSALLAVPIPTKTRPGASALSVAMEFAVTGALRVSGLVTQVPSLMPAVSRLANARYW